LDLIEFALLEITQTLSGVYPFEESMRSKDGELLRAPSWPSALKSGMPSKGQCVGM
jgi:hypothetical protein